MGKLQVIRDKHYDYAIVANGVIIATIERNNEYTYDSRGLFRSILEAIRSVEVRG